MHEAPWRTEIEVNAEDCGPIVARRFPELARRPVRHLGDGWCFRCFLLGDDLVVKFPKRAEIVDDLVGEIGFLPLLAGRLPVETPAITHRGEPGPDFPHPFLIETRVRGVAASQMDLDPRETERLVRDALTALEALQAVDGTEDWPGVGRWSSPVMLEDSRRDAEDLFEKIGDELDPAVTAALEDYYSSPRPPPSTRPSVLCHGDLLPEHLYLDPDSRRLTGIIDWGDANLGDPAQDVGGLGYLLPPARLAPLLRDAEPGVLERARYRVLVAALHSVWFGARNDSASHRREGERVFGAWLPLPGDRR